MSPREFGERIRELSWEGLIGHEIACSLSINWFAGKAAFVKSAVSEMWGMYLACGALLTPEVVGRRCLRLPRLILGQIRAG